ncbi:hypothetical protein C2U70_31525 [Bradyrhizobium guangdongense]|uniref:DUF3551 domain-containing protein n=1 Tax=Bradyrhizobium guangdongense TaxID=1325090 RepID=UPI00112A89C0|nr:DUF3551 domain-containing protein [Bradyrhizobium guangdongense]TPQ26581.1 hypothetical protein C2U70_31525 [Bradyrhizobium guangdongense]
MRTLYMVVALVATTLAIAPAKAQRYGSNAPVCLQKWEWGGSSSIYCAYASFEQCRASAMGLSAMCVANPYFSQGSPRDRAAMPGGRDSWVR